MRGARGRPGVRVTVAGRGAGPGAEGGEGVTRQRVYGTLRDHKPLRDRVREWLWIGAALVILAGGLYGTWHR